jgi:flagellar hook-length control protein FliK
MSLLMNARIGTNLRTVEAPIKGAESAQSLEGFKELFSDVFSNYQQGNGVKESFATTSNGQVDSNVSRAKQNSKQMQAKELEKQGKISTNTSDETKNSKDRKEVVGYKKAESTQSLSEEVKAVANKKSKQVPHEKDESETCIDEHIPVAQIQVAQIQELCPVIAHLMQQLQVSFEEVVEVLAEMDITSYDLTDEKVFGEFVSKLFNGGVEELLAGNNHIKDISKVFEEIENIITAEPEMMMKLADEKEIIAQHLLQKQMVQINQAVNEQPNGQVNGSESPVFTVGEDVKVNQPIQSYGQHNVLLNENVGTEMNVEGQTMEADLEFSFDNRSFQSLNTIGATKSLTTPSGGKIDFAQQIIEKIHLTALQNGKEISMELAPKELGRLVLKITEEQGVITANIKVENEKTKELIIQNLESLKESMQAQGLKVASFEVDVREDHSTFQMQQQKQKGSKRIEELLGKHLVEEELEEEEVAPLTESIVDYMA